MTLRETPLFQNIKKFFVNNFTVRTTKWSRLIGCGITAVLLAFVIILHQSYTEQTFSSKWLVLGVSLLLPFFVGIFIALQIHVKNTLLSKILHWVAIAAMPFLMITTLECLNNVFVYDMTYLGFIGNYLLLLLFYGLLFAITGSFKWTLLIVNVPLFGLGIAHNYISEFRGTPFLPMDFLGFKTAVNVAGTYNYKPTYGIITATLLMAIILTLTLKINTPVFKLRTKIITRVVSGVLSLTVFVVYYATSFFVNMGIVPDFWNQSRGYNNYGFSLMFFLNTRYLTNPAPPTGYSKEKVPEIVDKVVESDDHHNKYHKKNTPNIICIMNESLSDLSVLGKIKTNKPYMPFMQSLKKNTIKGNLYVPVIGAGTSNTEFEFLTGHSTAFLPSGSNAYMLYVKQPLATIVSTLEDKGYSSRAFHPYYSTGWNRVAVYENMGFDRFISLSDMFTAEYLSSYQDFATDPEALVAFDRQIHPQQDVLLRQYVSDSYDFKYLISDYENRDTSKPYFMFNVTMQNHGGYLNTYDNFKQTICLKSTTGNYPKANQYLSLIKRTDSAFKELLDYFSKVKEPTVICMFGDHQPSVENEFIAEVMGVKNLNALTTEQSQNRHITPFYIWANYNIEEEYIERMSVNYLSSLVLQTADIELSPFNEYLLNLRKILPVIDTVGYIDSEGEYYTWDSKTEYSEILDGYQIIQYNNIFDPDNRESEIFNFNAETVSEAANNTEAEQDAS